jgi:hypothetical protein
MVDGTDSHHPYTFDQALWQSGYEITATAADGYSATMQTADVPADAIFLIDEMDGEPVSPRLVGDMSRQFWVRDIVQIEAHLGQVVSGPDPDFRLVLEVNGDEHSFSIAQLMDSPFYTEGRGSYTTSAGTTYTSTWGGVRLGDLLNSYLSLRKEDTITFVAVDGYEMSYSGADVLDESSGTWILAVTQDGEYLPLDPGYIRTVKIGPETPDIPGHSSVRMIGKIAVSGKPYREFSLKISGLMDATLDRQTMQAGVSCHKVTVNYERRDSSGVYTGIPLWRLLAYGDDPRYAPHQQDSSIISYRKEAAEKGYTVELEAADGFVVALDSRELDGNDDVIVAMYKEGEELTGDEWPLVLVWDKDAEIVPDGIKPIRQISEIRIVIE